MTDIVSAAWICHQHQEVRVRHDRTATDQRAPRCDRCDRCMRLHTQATAGSPWIEHR